MPADPDPRILTKERRDDLFRGLKKTPMEALFSNHADAMDEENKQLELRIADLRAVNAVLQPLQAENKRLAERLAAMRKAAIRVYRWGSDTHQGEPGIIRTDEADTLDVFRELAEALAADIEAKAPPIADLDLLCGAIPDEDVDEFVAENHRDGDRAAAFARGAEAMRKMIADQSPRGLAAEIRALPLPEDKP